VDVQPALKLVSMSTADARPALGKRKEEEEEEREEREDSD
jgi:hypothetical protein